jgi:hypothetical protein
MFHNFDRAGNGGGFIANGNAYFFFTVIYGKDSHVLSM